MGVVINALIQPMHHLLLANAGFSFSFAVFSLARALLL
jgi:hypothetical protein